MNRGKWFYDKLIPVSRPSVGDDEISEIRK